MYLRLTDSTAPDETWLHGSACRSGANLCLYGLSNCSFCNYRGDEKEGQVYMWQGYTGRVELVSFRTFLSRPVKKVALGGDHSLILTHDDALFACGNNEHGQLGVASLGKEYSFDPCLVDSLTGELTGHCRPYRSMWRCTCQLVAVCGKRLSSR